MATHLDAWPQTALPSVFRRMADRFTAWRNRKAASAEFQSWASAFPLTRGVARREAARLYDLVAGFAYSQTLLACVELELFQALSNGPKSPEELSGRGVGPEAMTRLCQAASALDLMTRRADGRYQLGPLGAATLGVPGLTDMIRHHRVFYRDLSDPVALLRGEADPELARFWSYVDGAKEQPDAVATRYSDLMASSQAMVAEETLRALSLKEVRHLLDVGGGVGAFLTAVARAYPQLDLTLFDLPAVVAAAEPRLSAAGMGARVQVVGGSFLEDPFPTGAGGPDAISLVRVLYDHDDDVAARLLKKVYQALPPGGLAIISEPMSGGAQPTRAGDVYFGFYTLAMTSGRPRSAMRHAELLAAAGFESIRAHRTARPFITGVVSARKRG